MKQKLQKLVSFGFRLSRPFWNMILNNSERTRVILVSDERVLLVRNWLTPDQRWSFPGGGIKKDEVPAEAAAREVREEVSLIVSPKDLVDMGEFDIEEGSLRYSVRLFAEAISFSEVEKTSLAISEAKWFPISKLPSDREDLVEVGLTQWRGL